MNEKVNDVPNNTVPGHSQVEEMLESFTPQPGKRFYELINRSPWMQNSSQYKNRSTRLTIPSVRWVYGIALLLIILASISVIFIQPVRAIARQIIYSFITLPSDQIKVQVTLQNPGDLYHFSDPANFSISVDKAQDLAGFPIKELSNISDDLILVGAHYDPDYSAVALLYQADEYKLFLTQRPTSKGKDLFTIGSDAKIELVNIGELQGEFVMGGWKAVTTSESQLPEEQTSIIAVWDNQLPQYTLRWQSEGITYELRALGEKSPQLSELITFADGLK